MNLTLTVLPERLAVCQLPTTVPLPAGLHDLPFWSLTRTPTELSLVVPETHVPPGCTAELGWAGLRVEGPLDFALIGILAGLSATLAQAGVSIFALSTYDTDYILVRSADLPAARAALLAAGYRLQDD